jgi:hypothetical protein
VHYSDSYKKPGDQQKLRFRKLVVFLDFPTDASFSLCMRAQHKIVNSRSHDYVGYLRLYCTPSYNEHTTDELKGIPAKAFQHCYEQWKQRLRRCVAAKGNYFEGDNLDL